MTKAAEKRTWTFGIVGVGLVAALLFMAAWGVQAPNSEATTGLSSPDSNNPVEVSVSDGAIEMPDSLTAGTVALEVTNSSQQQAHSLAIMGPTEKRLDGTVAPGQSSTLEVDLQPGSYTAYCPVEGHREQESAEFTVGR